MAHRKKLVFYQTGDYRAAWQAFQNGAAETYRDQRASVDFVARLSNTYEVTTIASGAPSHDEILAQGLRSIGQPRPATTRGWLKRIIGDLEPDFLICRSPNPDVLELARARAGCHILPSFADIFAPAGLRGRLRMWRTARSLKGLACVSNHSLNASRSIAAVLGVASERIVPWDWSRVPVVSTSKTGPKNADAPTLFFAGNLTDAKGVGDCLAAVAHLRNGGMSIRFTAAGPGDLDMWWQRAAEAGLSDAVRFLGEIANTEVRAQMNAHDMVIVPSRHSYPEGLPNTIYEALASRSPLVLSNHPAFAGRLRADEECIIFRAAKAGDLAAAIQRLCTTPGLYGRLSEAAKDAHDRLYVGLEWDDLILRFLDDPEDRSGWVGAHSLAALDTQRLVS